MANFLRQYQLRQNNKCENLSFWILIFYAKKISRWNRIRYPLQFSRACGKLRISIKIFTNFPTFSSIKSWRKTSLLWHPCYIYIWWKRWRISFKSMIKLFLYHKTFLALLRQKKKLITFIEHFAGHAIKVLLLWSVLLKILIFWKNEYFYGESRR